MLIKGMKGRSDVNEGNEEDRLKIFLCARRDGRHSLDLPQAVKSIVRCECVEFIIED